MLYNTPMCLGVATLITKSSVERERRPYNHACAEGMPKSCGCSPRRKRPRQQASVNKYETRYPKLCVLAALLYRALLPTVFAMSL